jgi:ubiquinol-cytochrome c reductase cytochrome c1 subunit
MRNGVLALKRILAAIVVAIVLLTSAAGALAAGGDMELTPAENDVGNIASLQRGARNFMNYCSGCHSAKYVRYNTIARNLELSEDEVVENLMFNAEKTFETIQTNMSDEEAKRWFGQPPPDLSLMARAKGADYIYNFLHGFYLDPKSPTGVDNLYLGGTSMPHVLWELQGYQEAVFEETQAGDGEGPTRHFDRFEPRTAGTLSAEQYDDFVRDTVNFLEYISEPVRGKRRVMGVWVLMFLIFFYIVASMLKNQIWKDVS